ncbi:MAG: glycosyltransferase family 4 protein [Acidobacteriota bacterium]
MSPLPPVRSGIADYSVDLLPALAARADVRLIHLPGQPVADDVAARWPLVPADALGGTENRLPLYQMGNNEHHLGVWRLAMTRPGVLVLHDLVLHHFLVERTVARGGDLDSYREQMAADHGWIGAAVARPFRWPGAAGSLGHFALPAHRHLLAGQRGVLVHSAWAAEQLLEEMPSLRVRHLRMGVPLPEAADEAAGRAFRARRGLPLDRPLLGSFGFQTPIKRTPIAIEALARPELASAHLMIAGEVSPALDLEAQAAELGVADRVHLLGYLPFDELQAAIAASDVCLNLRYPTAGETSASLLRILAVGRPAVVSDHAQMADLPSAGLIHVPLGDDEVEALVERLTPLLAEPAELVALGIAARRFIARHHRVDDAAEAVVAACRAWSNQAPVGDEEPPSTRPATSFVGAPLDGAAALEVEGVERPWPPGARRRIRVRLRNGGSIRWLAGERADGGVALQLRLLADGEDHWAGRPWFGLPVDLPPGGEHAWELDVRRPLAEQVELELQAHVFGRRGGGRRPTWRETI